MIGRKSQAWVIGAMLLGGLCVPALAAYVDIHVDLQDTIGVTAPGYTALTGENLWSTTPPSPQPLGNGIGVAFTKAIYYQTKFKDRGASYGPLWRDFLNPLASHPGETFELRGLPPNHTFNLTLYSNDPQYPTKRTQYDIDTNADFVPDLSLTIQKPAPYNETQKTVQVTVSSAGILSIFFKGYGGTDGQCNAFDLVSVAPDTAPPAAIANLTVSEVAQRHVTLGWTAPVDDNGAWGQAASYDLRYSTVEINDTNWAAATPISHGLIPAAGGTGQSLLVTGLNADTTYYFAIKSADSSGNVSPLSNVPQAHTEDPDMTAPAAVTDLLPASIGPNTVTLTWTAVGDDDLVGTAASYEIRYSTSPISDGNWGAAATVTGLAAPKPAGSTESFRVRSLASSTTYYFAMKVTDEWPNTGTISNLASATTLPADPYAPGPVTDFRVTAMHITAAYLAWTIPSDVGSAGLGDYDVRFSTSPISEGNFASATRAQGIPASGMPGQTQRVIVSNLQPGTTYYFAVKAADLADPANVSPMSAVVTGTTLPQVPALTIKNPWIVNDRVSDTHNLQTMAATYVNAYTPEGVIPPANDEAKAINIYNNQKRRLYHWADSVPAGLGTDRWDPTYSHNVFGWSLCGPHANNACTIAAAAGLGQRLIAVPDDWQYELYYDGAWHLFHTMMTFYVYNRANPPAIASAAEIKADNSLVLNAAAEGRGCPGLFLCGDTPQWEASHINSHSDGGSGVKVTKWTGNMDLRIGESFNRTWEAWQNQHPTPVTNADPMPGADPPYHHEAHNDWKDYVNYPYWEPYGRIFPYIHTTKTTYRRWSNGTHVIAPDFTNPGYQAMLSGSANLATTQIDLDSAILHPATAGTPAYVVFRVNLPYYITDCNISGRFTRTNAGDVNKIYFGTTSNPTTLVWTNNDTGMSELTNLNLRNNVFGKWEFYVKVELLATGQVAGASVTDLVISTIYEHNKHSMAYLDKGANNITVTFDNPEDLNASTRVKLTYKWKEFDGTDWTIDRQVERYINTSPYTFTITTGGTRVPRTEQISLEVLPAPQPDPVEPAAVTDLTATATDPRKVNLSWTATADDENDPASGAATSYDIRYSTAPISEATWTAATPVANSLAPRASGSAEQFTVTGLQASTTYWFALKVGDEGNNPSALSNVAVVTTPLPDVTPPAWIGNLRGTPSRTASGAVDLAWTATADDGSDPASGRAATYELRYSTEPFDYTDQAAWASATPVAGLPTPASPGAAESFTVTGLTSGVQYYFALRVGDDGEPANVSELSNIAPTAASGLGERVLQNGLAGYNGCRDTYVDANRTTTNYGSSERMRITGYADAGNDIQRGFLKFDLSGIPAGTTIRSAKLYLYSYNPAMMFGSTGNYGLYPLTRAFTEGSVTWNLAAAGISWTSPGGDFLAAPDALSPKKAPKVPSWYDWNVTTAVQAWINGTGTNNGWCVKCDNEISHDQDEFYQSDTSNNAFRPKLVVSDYVEPVAGDITADGSVDVLDLLTLAESWTLTIGVDRGYDPRCDFNEDGSVDVLDLLTLAQCWPQ